MTGSEHVEAERRRRALAVERVREEYASQLLKAQQAVEVAPYAWSLWADAVLAEVERGLESADLATPTGSGEPQPDDRLVDPRYVAAVDAGRSLVEVAKMLEQAAQATRQQPS
ncbi:hypothetical protein [Tenggerimyces flavus]|uniref:Uncharacterized protein n=1 Tax=Tenggerimyces flavus TaxID=1708749 RepID=A0ABV7Y651_9ACTN|nr:hypothetical protein [Tenggerimyces flavus]MBM7790099.1 hypothetical protein [Tenggerimyces flavus]